MTEPRIHQGVEMVQGTTRRHSCGTLGLPWLRGRKLGPSGNCGVQPRCGGWRWIPLRSNRDGQGRRGRGPASSIRRRAISPQMSAAAGAGQPRRRLALFAQRFQLAREAERRASSQRAATSNNGFGFGCFVLPCTVGFPIACCNALAAAARFASSRACRRRSSAASARSVSVWSVLSVMAQKMGRKAPGKNAS